MADRIEFLKALAQEYNVRSPAKLKRQAQLEGVNVTLKEAQQALASNTARQVFAPKRRPQGRSAAPDVNTRLQYDLIDFSNNTSKKNKNRYALVGIDAFSREVASQTPPIKGARSSKRSAQEDAGNTGRRRKEFHVNHRSRRRFFEDRTLYPRKRLGARKPRKTNRLLASSIGI